MPATSGDYYDVFLSYNSLDAEPVRAVAEHLRQQGLKPFLDRWYLQPGQLWVPELERTLTSCRAVAVFVGPHGLGPWQQREAYAALDHQSYHPSFPVIPVLLPKSEPPLGFLRQSTWVDLRGGVQDQTALEILRLGIGGQPPGPEMAARLQAIRAGICPYRGLLYFREEDAPFFFGRDTAIHQLVEATQRQHFLAVAGASGSGKSSVVRAGLLPALRKDRGTVWEILTLVPGDQPLRSLSAALLPLLESDMTETDRLAEVGKLAKGLAEGHIQLRDIVHRILAKQSQTHRLLLVADQWEELYTLAKEDAARRRFVDELLDATAHSPLSVVATLRGDFVGKALAYRPLSDRLQGAQINLGPMTERELRLAIEKPATQVGLGFEGGLVERILEHVGGEPGNLPLLEFVLRRLWDQRAGTQLTNQAYDGMGRLQGAVAKRADEVFDRLNGPEQKVLRQVFLQIVRPAESGEDTRRRAGMSELTEEAQELVAKLASERLVVTTGATDRQEDTVEVAHEALIQHWGRLREWLNEDRAFLLWRERLRGLLREWLRAQRSEEALLRGPLLTEADTWLRSQRERLLKDELDFIVLSNDARDKRQQREREQHQRELAQAKALAEEATKREAAERARAETADRLAQEQRRLAAEAAKREAAERASADSARQLAGEAAKREEAERQRAVEAGKREQAQREQAEAAAKLAEEQRFRAEEASKVATERQTRIEQQRRAARRLYGAVGALGALAVALVFFWREAKHGRDLLEKQKQDITRLNADATWKEKEASAVLDGAKKQAAEELSQARKQSEDLLARSKKLDSEAEDKKREAGKFQELAWKETRRADQAERLAVFNGSAYQAALHGTNRPLAILMTAHALRFSPTPLTVISNLPFGSPSRLAEFVREFQAASPKNANLASPGLLGWLYSFTNGVQWKPLRTLEGHMHPVESVAFDPTGQTLASGSLDYTVKLWEPTSGKLLRTLEGHQQRVRSVAFDLTGQTLASGSWDKTVKLWERTSGKLLRTLEGSQDWVRSVAFDSTGQTLASGSDDTTVKLWERTSGKLLRTIEGHLDWVECVAFDPTGQTLVSGSSDHMVKLWEPTTGKLLRTLVEHQGWVRSVAFDPTGQTLASGSDDKTVKLWEPTTGKLLNTLAGHANSVESVAFDPTGMTLASGSLDKTVKLWEPASGKLLQTLQPSTNLVRSVAFSPDGQILAAAAGNNIFLWQASIGWDKAAQWLTAGPPSRVNDFFRSLAGRELTPAEVTESFGSYTNHYAPLWPDGKPLSPRRETE